MCITLLLDQDCVGSMSLQKIFCYHLPTRGQAGIQHLVEQPFTTVLIAFLFSYHLPTRGQAGPIFLHCLQPF